MAGIRVKGERGWECLSESVKKGRFVTKIFLKIILNEILKICEK